ncbi:MAG: hypothetical protein GY847_14460 [Proteobacteria bacterium]|nr:hypothetical protein [Pseudomonadota bacterium]
MRSAIDWIQKKYGVDTIRSRQVDALALAVEERLMVLEAEVMDLKERLSNLNVPSTECMPDSPMSIHPEQWVADIMNGDTLSRDELATALKRAGHNGIYGDDCFCGLSDLVPCDGINPGICKPSKL